MTAVLVVRWPVANPDARLWELEREARAEWTGHVAAAGIWGTTDPAFTVIETDDGQLQYVGCADAYLGPLEQRSRRHT